MRSTVAVALLALGLSGCTTMGSPTPEQLAQMQISDDQECLSYGFKPGTEGYAECRLHLADQHRADSRLSREEFAASMRQLSASMESNRPVTCNTSTSGSGGYFFNRQSTTTCY